MDPQVSGSFIPKKPLVETRHAGGGMGLFLLLSILLFVASLLAAGGVFAYQGILHATIASKDASLKTAEGAFEPDVISQLSRLDSRLINARAVLGNHTAPSAVFDMLSNIVLQQVQFTDFSYKLETNGSATITLSGVGDSFSTVALQSDQFSATRLLKDVVFSNVAIGQNGQVNFFVTATLDPSLYVYSRESQSTQVTPNPAPASQATSTTP